MFLLLYEDAEDKQIRWLCRNALTVAPAAWIHSKMVPGTIAITASSTVCKNLEVQIKYACINSIIDIEEKIKSNSLRGIHKKLAIRKLELIGNATNDMDIISHAGDLLTILGRESDEPPSEPDEIEKEYPLGIDKETVEN